MYLGEWKKNRDMVQSFDMSWDQLDGVEILLAAYSREDYSGWAFVLFTKEGKLYEVNGSHCSCYGLEAQWSPEETDAEAIKWRLNAGSFKEIKQELREVLRNI